jgi:hypothetical protein
MTRTNEIATALLIGGSPFVIAIYSAIYLASTVGL